MKKPRILIEFTTDKLDAVFYEIRAGIQKVTQQTCFDDEKLRIAMPKYFIDMLLGNYLRNIDHTPATTDSGKFYLFGIEVVLHYDNFIVVFHEDMPMFLENYYVVVNLK